MKYYFKFLAGLLNLFVLSTTAYSMSPTQHSDERMSLLPSLTPKEKNDGYVSSAFVYVNDFQDTQYMRLKNGDVYVDHSGEDEYNYGVVNGSLVDALQLYATIGLFNIYFGVQYDALTWNSNQSSISIGGMLDIFLRDFGINFLLRQNIIAETFDLYISNQIRQGYRYYEHSSGGDTSEDYSSKKNEIQQRTRTHDLLLGLTIRNLFKIKYFPTLQVEYGWSKIFDRELMKELNPPSDYSTSKESKVISFLLMFDI